MIISAPTPATFLFPSVSHVSKQLRRNKAGRREGRLWPNPSTTAVCWQTSESLITQGKQWLPFSGLLNCHLWSTQANSRLKSCEGKNRGHVLGLVNGQWTCCRVSRLWHSLHRGKRKPGTLLAGPLHLLPNLQIHRNEPVTCSAWGQQFCRR